MFRQRLVTLMNHFARIRVSYFLEIAIILAINNAHFFEPFASFSVKIVTYDLLNFYFLTAC